MRSSLFFLAALVAAPSAARADEVDDLIQDLIAKRKIPAISVVITKDDQVVKKVAFGTADLERDVNATTEHLFESGSIGKSYTAVVIMQLVQEGKLSPNDPLAKHLEATPESWKDVTVRHLLTHTSGLPDYALVPGLMLTERWTPAEWYEKIKTVPLDFPTGKQWAYSNTNYYLLGMIAEEITGESILELIPKRVFEPLGMKDSRLSDEMAIIKNRASGYYRAPNAMYNAPEITVGAGDGGWIQTAEDLIKYERGFREGKLVKPETVKQMITAARLPSTRRGGYGLGWFVGTYNGVEIYSHGGNTAGYAASITRIPSANLTIALLCNVQDQGGDALAREIATLYVPELKPQKPTESPDPHADFSANLKEALQKFAAGETEQTIFDPEYVERLKQARSRMIIPRYARFREIESFAYLDTRQDDPDKLIRYRVKADGKSHIVTFAVTKENKLYSIGFSEEQ